MNLHQAKGLEARVVVLADPSPVSGRPPDLHVERRPDGTAVGWLRRLGAARRLPWRDAARSTAGVARQGGSGAAASRRAEQVRLLYVAATRAREELVVARRPDRPDASPWSALDPWLAANGTELALEMATPRPREALHETPDEIARRVEGAAERLRRMGEPSFRHVTVTEVAKADRVDDPSGSAAASGSGRGAFRGYSWGSAVHGALAAAASDDSEVTLRAACRALLIEHGRPLDDHGEPREVEELLALVRSVRASELWRRAAEAGRVLVEVPFAAPGATRLPDPPPRLVEPVREEPSRTRRQLDLFGGEEASSATRDAPPTEAAEPETDAGADAVPAVLEGVIDLAFREREGWVIADYKTDVGTDPEFPARVEAYRRQVDLYAEAWTRLTGEPVKERVLFFTTQGRVEAW